jgi:Ni2+-binding GTPase involved in maturation of urease and hydrogenase
LCSHTRTTRPCDLDRALGYLREVNSEQQLFLTSALSGEALDEWYAHLRSKVGAAIGG